MARPLLTGLSFSGAGAAAGTRARAAAPGPPPSERERGRAVLEEWGTTPLSRIGLLPGYEYALLAGGRCVVPFQPRGGCALALGGPVGPRDQIAAAVQGFTHLCRRRGLHPVFVPVPEDEREAWTRAGFRSLGIGENARVDLGRFDLRGNRRKSVRQSANRARRAGLGFELWEPPHDPRRLRLLREVSAAWLGSKRLPERRFGTGRFDAATLARVRLAVVRNRFGRVEAFTNLIEGYSTREGSLDLMRSRPDASPGAMDLLFVGVATRFRREGKDVLDLGLAPLARESAPRSGIAERLLHHVYRHGEPFYNFRGLRAFKAKFQPEWERRYLVYPSAAALPRALLALAEVGPRSPGGTAHDDNDGGGGLDRLPLPRLSTSFRTRPRIDSSRP